MKTRQHCDDEGVVSAQNLHASTFLLSLIFAVCCLAISRYAFGAPPLEAELIRTIGIQDLKLGDEVLLKVEKSWTDGKCSVARASVLHARVLEIGLVPGTTHEQIALQPSYPCNEPPGEPLFVFAVLAPEDDEMPLQLREFRSATFGQSVAIGSAGNNQSNHVDLSGRQNPTLPVATGRDESEISRHPTSLHAGQIWKLKKIVLRLGAGPDHSTVIETTSGHLRMSKGTVLVLTESEPRLHSSEGRPELATLPAVSKTVFRPIVPALSPCHAPQCTSSTSMFAATQLARPASTLSLKGVKYSRPKQVEMLDAGYDAAVSYLGADKVLFTFNVPELVHHKAGTHPNEVPRAVKAVVFDIKSQRKERSLSWEVPDHNQYLWPLPGGRILVHNGDELQLLGEALELERTLSLTQPLIYVRVSPNGRHFAVGTRLEVSTVEETKQLSQSDGVSSEERIVVALYDNELNKVDQVYESASSTRPVLLNTGYAQLRMTHQGEFYLRFQDFERKMYRDFGRMKSECVPTISTFSANLLMAETCDTQKLDDNIEVFSQDGTHILHTSVDWRTLTPTGVGNEQQRVFALSTIKVGGAYVHGSLFQAQDAEEEAIIVQDSSDGRNLLHLEFPNPAPSSQPISLSPNGDQLAVFTGEKIEIYDVPAVSPTK